MTPRPNLSIDPQRLWDDIMETATIGANARGGLSRLALTEDDRAVRDWLARACGELGLPMAVDDCGSMFFRRPGRRPDLPPIVMGSHLDTQPTGGRFDGVLGVLAALEVVRTLAAAGYETNAPLEIVNWTNEEGSRFAPAMLASGVFAGAFDAAYAHTRTDREGATFADALRRIGYMGGEAAVARRIGAYFELHIEQGPILEAEGKTIGVVTGVQGVRWFEATILGRSAHTGATPMRLRRDALLGAARAVEAVNRIGLAHAPEGVASVGLLEVRPNSRNVVPGEVFLSVDLRHPDDAVLDAMEAAFRQALDDVLRPLDLGWSAERIWANPAVRFDERLVATVRRGAARAGFPARDIVSGAGHDAAYVARVAPAAMIFVPCADGVSHNEAESVSFADCGAGAQVLLEAVLDHDASLA